MKKLEDFVASRLLQLKAIKLQPHNPFMWATGWESPIYFDSRKLLSYPRMRDIVKIELARTVMENFPEVEVIAAVAVNAIAMGMLVAEELGLPFVYVHPSPKDHGLENMIEGDLRPRQKVVVIEDQVSVGVNSLGVVDAIRKNGCYVIGMVTIFNYQLHGTANKFSRDNVELCALTNFDSVLNRAIETNVISDDDVVIFKNWQKNPAKWQK